MITNNTNNTNIQEMTKLIYPKLSYQIVGILYKIYNQLGFGYQEKYYKRAIAGELNKLGLKFRQELPFNLKYEDQYIGRYFIDFLIEDKIVLEIKVANEIYTKHKRQVLGHLKETGLKLGILSIFTKDGIKYKRLIN